MTEHHPTLEVLRTAAERREWNTLQDTLHDLLETLDPLIALGVAITRAQEFLPVFETYYPRAGWVRELLLYVVSYGTVSGVPPTDALTQFPKPGCGNFVMAVLEIAHAVQVSYRETRYNHITDAVAHTILADLQHTYYNRRSDEYAQLLAAESDANAVRQMRAAFWMDAEVAQRDTALWLRVAEEIAGRIERN